MPKTRAADGGHSAFTDHFIRRPSRATAAPGVAARSLVPFWGGTAHARERGLAYADVAQKTQSPAHYSRALDLLKEAEAAQASDGLALMRLAFLYSRSQHHRQAMQLYERALKLDPSSVTAAVNLATYLAWQGRMPEAIRLWQDALSREAGVEAPGINLARAYLQAGDPAAAREILIRVQEHNPDSAAVWEALSAVSVQAIQK
jgi:FimV-like protein